MADPLLQILARLVEKNEIKTRKMNGEVEMKSWGADQYVSIEIIGKM